MPTFKLPLSGDVVQSINPFTAFMTGGQFGLVNINLGQSSEPKVEEEVLSDVATYGKQLGRIGDALIVPRHGGSKALAYSVHGGTAVVMVATALMLLLA